MDDESECHLMTVARATYEAFGLEAAISTKPWGESQPLVTQAFAAFLGKAQNGFGRQFTVDELNGLTVIWRKLVIPVYDRYKTAPKWRAGESEALACE